MIIIRSFFVLLDLLLYQASFSIAKATDVLWKFGIKMIGYWILPDYLIYQLVSIHAEQQKHYENYQEKCESFVLFQLKIQ